MRERESANRTREAGHRHEIERVVANTLNLSRNGAVGFIVWLDLTVMNFEAHNLVRLHFRARGECAAIGRN